MKLRANSISLISSGLVFLSAFAAQAQTAGFGGFAAPGAVVGGASTANGGVVNGPAVGMTGVPNLATTGPTGSTMGMGASNLGAQPARPDLSSQDFNLATKVASRLAAQQPSQFQRFVQESTGVLLNHFGQSLFDNPQKYGADQAALPSADYVLGAGDEVRIQLWGAVDYAGSHTIDRTGQINLPKLGTVRLAGVAVKDLELTLRKQLSTVYNNVNLNATLGKMKGVLVYVVGQAGQPGSYNLSGQSTLVNALFASGGPSANGSMRQVQLKRNGQVITSFDLYDFIAKGDKSKDAQLLSGDVIVIPPAGAKVAILGAWDHAAIYELKPGEKLKDVLELGGGTSSLVSTHKALIERVEPNQSTPRSVQNLALDAQGLSTALKDADVITLLGISPAFANAVTLQGTVAAPLRYKWSEGMRISDLIPERDALITADYYKRKNKLVQFAESEAELEKTKAAGSKVTDRVRSLVDQINWDYAVVERLNKSALRNEIIPFNLGKAVISKDPEHNLQLLAGDVVTIMSSTDLRLPADRQTRLVRVEGEVAAPGVYQALPGETLPKLIKRIGGVTPQAYLFGLEFTRETIRRQQQQNLDQLIRKLEAQLQSASSANASNLTGERAAQAGVILQAQQSQMQAQIAKLKSLKSQGRVALELDVETLSLEGRGVDKNAIATQFLPNLPLEDGDAIVVPSLPAFVAAAGSVNNENVFIYKAGKTVGDVLNVAGLTEEAEPSEAFVLRADGSLVSRRSLGFFSSFENLKLMPGDTVVVPAQIDRENKYNFVVRALKDWTQILGNLGLGIASIKSIKSL